MTASPTVWNSVAVADPDSPAHVIKPNADGSINVATTGSDVSAVNLTKVGGTSVALGQAAMAASLPVVLASDQTAVPVAQQASATGGASFAHIGAGQATTTVKSGAGTLYAIVFNGVATTTNVTTVYDNTAGSGTVIAIPQATLATGLSPLMFGPAGLKFSTGLTIVTATANGADMTVVYK